MAPDERRAHGPPPPAGLRRRRARRHGNGPRRRRLRARRPHAGARRAGRLQREPRRRRPADRPGRPGRPRRAHRQRPGGAPRAAARPAPPRPRGRLGRRRARDPHARALQRRGPRDHARAMALRARPARLGAMCLMPDARLPDDRRPPRDDRRVDSLRMSIEYRADIGLIVAPPGDVDPLLRCAAEARAAPDDAALRERLAEAGALEDDRPHPQLAAVLALVRDPICEMRVEHGARVCHVWVARATAVLAMPQPDERVRIVGMPTEFVAEALSRLVALGPRARPDAPVGLELAAGDLARLLAVRERPGRLGDDAAEAAALDAIATGPTAHWRIDARFGADAGRALEVLDTPAGMWLVRPDGDRVELWPATPTTVFAALVELLPDDDELVPGDESGAPGRS